MVVTVNGQTIDITVEKERTLGELLSGIEAWLEKDGFSLSGFAVDGDAVKLDGVEAACGRDLDEIERVDIRASTWAELMREALTAAARSLEERLKGGVDAADIDASWNDSPSASFLAGHDAELHALISKALSRADGMADGRADASFAASLVKERIAEIDAPKPELLAIVALFSPLASEMEDLPLALQTGKDAQAAATLARFAALATKLFRLVPLLRFSGMDLGELLVNGNDFRSYIEDLAAALKELVAAQEGGDAVLVGDLAEYELAPRLRSLADAIERALAA